MGTPRRYNVSGSATNTASQTVLGATSAATIRPAIYEIDTGSQGAPADQQARYQIQRYTAAGTSTAVTPQALDNADPASLMASTTGRAHSAEPTYTASAFLLEIGVNQRVTFRWVAVPGSELLMPATAANGLGMVTNAVTSTWTAVNTFLIAE